ncbi:MAG: hypothetical protein Q9213_004647 [Squamulea squamosa]
MGLQPTATRTCCDVLTIAKVLEGDLELVATGARVGVEGRGGMMVPPYRKFERGPTESEVYPKVIREFIYTFRKE